MEKQTNPQLQHEQQTVETSPKKGQNEEDPPSTSHAQLFQQLTASLNQSMDEKLQQLMKEVTKKRPADGENSSDNEDDVLSLFARDSFVKDLSPAPKRVRKDAISTTGSNSVRSDRTGSNRSKSKSDDQDSTGSNRSTKPEAGSNRKKVVASTGSNCAKIVPKAGSNRKENEDPHGNPNDEDPSKLDVVEEMMRQAEEEIVITDDYGPKITQSIAERAVKYFTKGAKNSETRSAIFKKHKLAENVSEIDTPKMNPGILKLGKQSNKAVQNSEKSLYNIQNNVTRSAMAVTSVINMAMLKEANSEMIHPKEVTTTCLEAISLLGYVSKELSSRRKDNIRNTIAEDLRSLCDHDRETTKYLLGDDLSKSARDAREIGRLGRKSGGGPSRNNNNYRKQDRHSSSSSYPNPKYQHQNANKGNSSGSKPFLSQAGHKSKKR